MALACNLLLFLDLRLKPLYVIITIPFIFITTLIVSVAITHCLPDISHFLSFPPLLYIWICAPKHSMPSSSSPSQVSSSSSLIAYPISATFFPFLPFFIFGFAPQSTLCHHHYHHHHKYLHLPHSLLTRYQPLSFLSSPSCRCQGFLSSQPPSHPSLLSISGCDEYLYTQIFDTNIFRYSFI